MSFTSPQIVNPNDPTQATSGKPAANPNADINRLLQQLQKKVHDLELANTSGGPAPIGSIMAYAGTGDPPGGEWVVCDGRLVDRTTYSAFFAAVGHAYNGGLDPGNNMVKIPDKRGRCSRGAIDMGTGPAPNDNTRSQTAQGSSGGEVSHTLSASESGLPGHGHSVNDPGHTHAASVNDPGHTHGTTVTDTGHSHTVNSWTSGESYSRNTGTIFNATVASGTGNNVPTSNGAWSGGPITASPTLQSATTGVRVSNSSSSTGVTVNNASVPAGISVGSAAAADASQGHNNLDPYEADTYIVRIA